MNREDFPLLKQDIIYFDNAATTLKPKEVMDAILDYYQNYSANAHRGDYDMSMKVDKAYEGARSKVQEFIHAKNSNEIIFTSGTTDSINKIVLGFMKHYLKEDDEVLLTLAEHASNILPWFELQEEKHFKINYIPLENGKVTLENIKKVVNKNTKVISLAMISNVLGDKRDIKEITSFAHQNNILVFVDGAQALAHTKIDVEDMDIDFFAASSHKTYGPTGLGIIYGKEKLLNQVRPIIVGGGMNSTFTKEGVRIYHELPSILEAGTPNIEGAIGFGAALSYLEKIGIEKIEEKEQDLKKYCVKRLKEVKNITIYNEDIKSSMVAFNIDDIFAQDVAIYLNKYHICVRAGNHCAKMLKEEIPAKNTVRISFGLYNTKEEIDRLIEVLKNEKIKEEIILP